MLTIILENSKGQQMRLTNNEAKFTIDKVTGLNPPASTLYFTENIGDGDQFQHERTGKRNVVINMFINGDVERNTLDLYEIVQTGKYIKIYITKEYRNVWIEGRVETCEIDNFTMNTTCQISILCPEPWWKDFEQSINTMNSTESKFYFPYYTVEPKPVSVYNQIEILTLINKGNVSSGMTIEMIAKEKVVNPIIYNRKTREYIGLGSSEKPYEMKTGDKIIISSYPNNKKIKLVRDTVETNIFNSLTQGSKFLEVDVGENIFTFTADEGSEYLDIAFKHYSQYKGI